MKTPLRLEFEEVFEDCILNLSALHHKNAKRNADILSHRFGFKTNEYLTINRIRRIYKLPYEEICRIIDSFLTSIRNEATERKYSHSYELLAFLSDVINQSWEQRMPKRVVEFYEKHFSDAPPTRVFELVAKLLLDQPWDEKQIYGYYKRKQYKEYIPEGFKYTTQEKRILRKAAHKNYLKKVIWPDQKRIINNLTDEGFKQQRSFNHELEKERYAYYSDKLDRPINCESSLEYKFAKYLDSFKQVKEIIEQPVAIPYYMDNMKYRYFPDFLVRLADNTAFFTEIKPLYDMVLEINQHKLVALWEYCKKEGFGLLYTQFRRGINDLYNYKHNKLFEKELKALLDKHGELTLAYGDFLDFQEQYDIQFIDISAIALKNRWTLHRENCEHYIKAETPNPKFYDLFPEKSYINKNK